MPPVEHSVAFGRAQVAQPRRKKDDDEDVEDLRFTFERTSAKDGQDATPYWCAEHSTRREDGAMESRRSSACYY
eukprot:6195380-Pleurochrysis_carterae.AAC.4